jgi:ribonuclease P protein component
LPKPVHLRSSGEFRRVYSHGKRYDGSLMTAFIQPNDLQHHRFGVTASRKAIGNAVERNRSKRLLRETFRQSGTAVEGIEVKCDWVLNAKRSLLSVKVSTALEEFHRILVRVRNDACHNRTGAE